MSHDRKKELLAIWHRMLGEPDLYIDPEELYDILIEMANSLERDGVINAAEWLQLVREASAILA
ncbi:hypothetical protein BI292_06145 [Pseudomonas sp. 43NM1]|uniref:hypothetical protein n=1 Tax=Pseudomonas sp. 43NM1 TaxID=1904755 RepID=UPI000C34226A|nr:hypothetical protein [Pseudomonas sp. 43NM1]PKH12588.1 hypothetical protein BI292_06145 [Pseudomonas sp. 43NM1]